MSFQPQINKSKEVRLFINYSFYFDARTYRQKAAAETDFQLYDGETWDIYLC